MIIFIADFGQDHNNNGMVNGFCLCTIVFNGFSTVANHWFSMVFGPTTIGPDGFSMVSNGS